MTDKARFPYFRFYPGDFILDMTVEEWPVKAIGGYIMLICYCWQYDGLPNDYKTLAKLSQLGRSFDTYSALILSKFCEGEDGKLHHKRLDEERIKTNHISEVNRDNVRKRWNKTKDKPDTTVLPIETDIETEQKQNKKRKADKRPIFDPSNPELWPESFRAYERFMTAWIDFAHQRAENRKKITERAFKMLHKKLVDVDPSLAADAVERSIENNWTSVFIPDQPTKKGNGPIRKPVSEPNVSREIPDFTCKHCNHVAPETAWIQSKPGSGFHDECPNCHELYRSWTPS